MVHYTAELSRTSVLLNNHHLVQQFSFLPEYFGLKTLDARIVLSEEGLRTETLQKKWGLLIPMGAVDSSEHC